MFLIVTNIFIDFCPYFVFTTVYSMQIVTHACVFSDQFNTGSRHIHKSCMFCSPDTFLRASLCSLWCLCFCTVYPSDAFSAVYAIVVCLCVCHTPVLYQNG